MEHPRYGMSIDQLPARAIAAAEQAELARARTVIYRAQTPIAAIVPLDDLDTLDPPDPGESGPDPLLSLCGSCRQDAFVDSIAADYRGVMVFRQG